MRSKAQKTVNYVLFAKLGVIGLVFLFIAAVYLPQLRVNSQDKETTNVPAGEGGGFFSIKGGVFNDVTNRNGQEVIIDLPGIEVFLRNVGNGAEIGGTTTDFDGRYHVFTELAAGQFTVCSRGAGWQESCGGEIITNTAPVQYVAPLEITAINKSGLVAGRVTMRDGTPCTLRNGPLGILQESFIQVVNLNGTELTPPVKTNNAGFFALTQVAQVRTALKARCGSITTIRPLKSSDQINMDNINPVISNVVAYDGKNAVRFAGQGEKVTVKVNARDDLGDTLTYNFVLPPNAGALGQRVENTVEWHLPDRPGNFTLYAVVSDNKGGAAFRPFSIIVNSDYRPLFSGRVVDENDQPIEDVKVTVNTQSVQTGQNGGFMMNVGPAGRYVLNAAKRGHIPVTRVFDSAKKGSILKMARAFSTMFEPRRVTSVTEPNRGARRGSALKIPANALINTRTGQSAVSPLQLSMATLDIGAGELPGNNGAVDRNDNETTLISFGAVFIEITDESGDRYDLRPGGMKASLTLPVEPGMIDTAPPSIQTWSFDAPAGTWNSLSVGQLDNTDWVTALTTLSTVNADIPTNAPACVQVNIDINSTLSGTRARFSSPNFSQTFDLPLDDPITMIYGLPEHIPLNVDVIDSLNNAIPNIRISDLTGPVLTNPFDSGATTSPPAPPYPYSSCDRKIKLEILIPGTVPTFPFLTRKGQVGNNASAAAYFNVIDPLDNRQTLGGWWQQNGFDQTGNTQVAGEVSAAYFNNNDLHFGREMHCLKTGLNVACYVSNYPTADDAQAALDDPADKVAAAATVTMEYKAIDGQPPANRIVKFFAYQGGTAAAPLFLSPDLDGNGTKGIPQLCIQCHGGNYFPSNSNSPTLAEVDLKSSFREFDLDTFLYPSTNSRAAQESNFKSLNDQVVASAPSPAIQDLIQHWYPGGVPPQNNTYVPPGWSVEPNLYLQVVATSCRTCHIAQPDNTSAGGTSGIDFTKYDDAGTFADFKGRVFQSAFCGPNKYMPHAKVTYENFWLSTSPARPQFLSQTLFGTPCDP